MNAYPKPAHHSAETLSTATATVGPTISVQAISHQKPWRDTLFDFPDDGGECLADLLSKIPQHGLDLTTQPCGYRLRLPDQGAHIVMVLAVTELRALASYPFLGANELFVPFDLREECEAALLANGAVGRWNELEYVSGTDAALEAFEDLWTRDVLPLL